MAFEKKVPKPKQIRFPASDTSIYGKPFSSDHELKEFAEMHKEAFLKQQEGTEEQAPVESITRNKFKELITAAQKAFPSEDRIDPDIIYEASSFEELYLTEEAFLELLLKYHNYIERVDEAIAGFLKENFILQSKNSRSLQKELASCSSTKIGEIISNKEYPNYENIIYALRGLAQNSLKYRLLLDRYDVNPPVETTPNSLRKILEKRSIYDLGTIKAVSEEDLTNNSSEEAKLVEDDEF